VVSELLGRSSVIVHVIVNKLFEGGVLVSFGVWCGRCDRRTSLLHALTNDEKRSSLLHAAARAYTRL